MLEILFPPLKFAKLVPDQGVQELLYSSVEDVVTGAAKVGFRILQTSNFSQLFSHTSFQRLDIARASGVLTRPSFLSQAARFNFPP